MTRRLKLAAYATVVFGVLGASPNAQLVGQETELGPVDGHDLEPTDLERIVAGVEAPDFTVVTLAGEALTLSDLRGDKNVVLFFYRGHW